MKKRMQKPKIVDGKLFVLPYVLLANQPIVLDDEAHKRLDEEAQKRLEEAALLARWRRKHQPIT